MAPKSVKVTTGAGMSMTLDGLDSLQIKLALLGKTEGMKAIRTASRAVAQEVAKEAKKIVPVDTGLLKKSIKVRSLPRSRVRIGHTVTTGKTEMDKARGQASTARKSGGGKKKRKSFKLNTGKAFYGAFIEFGLPSRNIEPHPFLRPAAGKVKPHAKKIYRTALREAIRKLKDPNVKASKLRASARRRAKKEAAAMGFEAPSKEFTDDLLSSFDRHGPGF